MARTPSTMVELGKAAADFRLPDTAGNMVTLASFADAPALLVIFLCNHCPFVIHIRAGLAELANQYSERGLAIVGINANDADAYPADAPACMAEEKERAGYPFPYLFDETQEVAKAYRAACTPDFFLFDGDRHLVYRGQFDDSRPENGLPVTGADLRRAVDAILADRPLPTEQKPSIGCNIKWRPGNEPSYFG
jgi:peroxiredoxin